MPAQGRWQRVEQVALDDHAPGRRDVHPRAAYGGRVDVRGVQPHRPSYGQGGPERTRAAAQVHHQGRPGTAVQQAFGLVDEQPGAVPRHEDAGLDDHPDPAELRPPDDVLQRLAGDPAGGHRRELLGGPGGVEQQRGLLLGEHAAGRAEPQHQLLLAHAPDPGTSADSSRSAFQRVSAYSSSTSERTVMPPPVPSS